MTNDESSPPNESQSALSLREIPGATVSRLILYARELQRLQRAGETHVSSRALGELLSVTDAVVRRDVSYLGHLGRRGIGYEIKPLIRQIRVAMGTNVTWKVALIGAGSLGTALLRYRGFADQGFQWVAAFDSDPNRTNQSVSGVPIVATEQMEQAIARDGVSLVVLAVPADAANGLARRLADAGVVGILNFAPVTLEKFPGVCVVNVDLASELQQLTFAVVSQPSEAE